MFFTSADLIRMSNRITEVRESLKGIQSTDPEIPRMIAIARTHLETAEAFIERASDRIP